MKKRIQLFLILTSVICQLYGQENEEGVDLLKAPASPASQLLNISPTTIERPTDLASLWISVTNTTEGLAKFPTNYSVDLSPASLFGSKIITLKDLNSTRIGNVMWQSFVISTGIKQEEDTLTGESFYKTALGIKFSIIRPQWSEQTNSRYKEIIGIQNKITKLINVSLDEVMSDSAYINAVEARDKFEDEESEDYKEADDKVNEILARLMTEKRIERIANNASMHAELKKKARAFRIERVGPFLDFAGGFSASFPTNQFNYSLGDRSGAWITGGYEGGEKKLSFLGIVRYLYQPESIFADPTGTIPVKNISTLDMGARLLYATRDDQFAFSFESIYRSVLTRSIIDPSWKLNFSAEYDLGFNQKISLSFGRDFDGVLIKGGNLIAALNFITGFGTKKALK